MDISTRYLGFRLKNPLIPGASPLSADLDMVRRLEDAGAPAIVLRSLFEEEIRHDARMRMRVEAHMESYAESLSFLPGASFTRSVPEEYLEHVRRVKAAIAVPVIASLNGSSPGEWTIYAKRIEEAGADALELNIYFLATDPHETGADVEARCVEALREVKSAVAIPVAVKLAPYYSSLANLAHRLDLAGADGLVLFNRFYQPDIDAETMEIVPSLTLSSSNEVRLRLRWLAALSGRIGASLASSGGVHTGLDAVKALMAGAHAVQMVSSLLINGPEHLARVRESLVLWMEEHAYVAVREMQGSMSLRSCPNPKALERANYMRTLESWHS